VWSSTACSHAGVVNVLHQPGVLPGRRRSLRVGRLPSENEHGDPQTVEALREFDPLGHRRGPCIGGWAPVTAPSNPSAKPWSRRRGEALQLLSLVPLFPHPGCLPHAVRLGTASPLSQPSCRSQADHHGLPAWIRYPTWLSVTARSDRAQAGRASASILTRGRGA